MHVSRPITLFLAAGKTYLLLQRLQIHYGYLPRFLQRNDLCSRVGTPEALELSTARSSVDKAKV